jgi:hypothetical protein
MAVVTLVNEFKVYTTKKDKIWKINCASYDDNGLTTKATATGYHNDDKDASVSPWKEDLWSQYLMTLNYKNNW